MNIKDALNEVQIKYLSAKLCCCILVLQLGYHHQKWNFEMVFVHFGVKYFLKKHFLFLCYCVSISHSSIFISILTAKCVITKGQLISKCLFYFFNSPKKNNSTWVKSNFFVRFFGRIEDTKINWPLVIRNT